MVSSSIDFSVEELEKKCQTIINSLTEANKEEAANTSYIYLKSSIEGNKPPVGTRDKYAMQMAMRHLVAEDGDADMALKKMRLTIQYRKDMKIDVIRLCFNESIEMIDDEEVKSLHEYYRESLFDEMKVGKLFVRGKCLQGRPLSIVLGSRYTSGFSEEWYIKYNIYNLERAIACAERESDGQKGKVISILNLGDAKNKPPFRLSRDLIYCLQNHYPERVDKIILIDAPFIFRAFYALVRPFMNSITKNTILFITGDDAKRKIMNEIVCDEQAMPFVLPEGKLTSEIDVKRYLYDIPFDHVYSDP